MDLSKENIASYFQQKSDQLIHEYKVKEIYLFGSFATGKASPSSDIDIMYELQDGKQQTFREHMSLLFMLEDHFGRTVDLVRQSNFNPIIYMKAKESMHRIL